MFSTGLNYLIVGHRIRKRWDATQRAGEKYYLAGFARMADARLDVPFIT